MPAPVGYEWSEELEKYVPMCTGYMTNDDVTGECTKVTAASVLNEASGMNAEEEEVTVKAEWTAGVSEAGDCWSNTGYHFTWGEDGESWVKECVVDEGGALIEKIAGSLTQRWDSEAVSRSEAGDWLTDNVAAFWQLTKDGWTMEAENKSAENKGLVSVGTDVAEAVVKVAEEVVAQIRTEWDENTNKATTYVSAWDMVDTSITSPAGHQILNVANDKILTYNGLSQTYQVESHTAAEAVSYSWDVYSDERLKEDIKEIESGDKIALLKPKSFVKDGKAGSGFVAQDVEEVFPNSVKENSDGIKAMSHVEIIAHLVKFAQGLGEKVQKLSVEVEALKAG